MKNNNSNKSIFNLTNYDRDCIARNSLLIEKDIEDYRDIYTSSKSSNNRSSSNSVKSEGNIFTLTFKFILYMMYRLGLVLLYFVIIIGGFILAYKCVPFLTDILSFIPKLIEGLFSFLN